MDDIRNLSRRQLLNQALKLSALTYFGSNSAVYSKENKQRVKYFLPQLAWSHRLPKQTGLQDKFGGSPWGFPEDLWPRCKSCKSYLSLVAQFIHHPERLNLGKPERVLHFFLCTKDLDNDYDSLKYNKSYSRHQHTRDEYAILILEPKQMHNVLSRVPHGGIPRPEGRIINWEVGFDEVRDYTQSVHKMQPKDKITQATKLGGVPWWVYTYMHVDLPTPPWRFIGQLHGDLGFKGLVPPQAELQTLINHYAGRELPGNPAGFLRHEGDLVPDPYRLGIVSASPDRWGFDMRTIGHALGYLFVNTAVNPPKGEFVTQN